MGTSQNPQGRGPVLPSEALLEMTAGHVVAQLIYVAGKLGIADLLKDGPRGAGELAQATATCERALYRVLRALASLGVFAEDADGRFALTPVAQWLRSDVPGSLRDYVVFVGEAWHLRPWEEILHSVRTGRPAFDVAHGAPAFEWLGRHPEAAQAADDAMTALTAHFAPALIEAFDFSTAASLVDVGGGNGVLLAAILRACPNLRGLLFDLPYAIEGAGARGHFAAQGVSDRVELVAGSFFESLPAGADLYLLKDILHDWSDEECVAILRNCRRAVAPTGRILAIERVVEPGSAPSPAKLLDIEMLVMLTGRERTEEEFRALFEAAGLRLSRVLRTRSPWRLIEAVRP